jgi:hypothetical protein
MSSMRWVVNDNSTASGSSVRFLSIRVIASADPSGENDEG